MNPSLSENERSRSLPTILVVEDDPAMQRMLCQVIAQEGCQVLAAADAEQCLVICQHHRPDVILLNAMLPGVDGFTCCAQLQTSSNPPPVVMITSFDDLGTIERIFQVGAIDYITKPIRLVVLRQRLRRLLQTHQVMKELRQQTERERLLKAMTLKIHQSLDLDQILSTSVREARLFLKVDRVALYRIHPSQGGTFVVESVAPGWTSVLDTPLVDPCFDEVYASRYRQGRVSVTDDIYQAGLPDCYVELLARIEIRANLVVPVVYQDELWGLLCAHQCSAARQWESFEVELLCQLASQMAIAIQQSRLFRQLEEANRHLQRLASADSLTQLANRRYFDEYFEQEWQRMAREVMPLALILIDVDYFKNYNDTYGHQAGDHCLQQVASTINHIIRRPADLAARYGGEEFAIILPNTGVSGALQVAETIRSAVKSLGILHPNSQVAEYVTVSLGVASAVPQPASPVTAATLFATADRALYRAKAVGRDAVISGSLCEVEASEAA